MAGRRRRQRAERPPVDAGSRDFVIARIGIARTQAQAAVDSFDEALGLFAAPEDDRNGSARVEALEEALELLGCATRAAEAAEEKIDTVDPEVGEPWDTEEESDG